MTRTIIVDREIEVWKDIPGYPDYMICRDGRVWSNLKSRVLKGFVKDTGYIIIDFRKRIFNKNNKRWESTGRTIPVHELVLTAFVGERPNKDFCCNHKNGIKTDNFLENIEWCTYSENNFHRYEMGLHEQSEKRRKHKISLAHRGDQKGCSGNTSKLTKKNIFEIRKLLENGMSQSKIASIYNVSHSTIYDIKMGRRWKWVK